MLNVKYIFECGFRQDEKIGLPLYDKQQQTRCKL